MRIGLTGDGSSVDKIVDQHMGRTSSGSSFGSKSGNKTARNWPKSVRPGATSEMAPPTELGF